MRGTRKLNLVRSSIFATSTIAYNSCHINRKELLVRYPSQLHCLSSSKDWFVGESKLSQFGNGMFLCSVVRFNFMWPKQAYIDAKQRLSCNRVTCLPCESCSPPVLCTDGKIISLKMNVRMEDKPFAHCA